MDHAHAGSARLAEAAARALAQGASLRAVRQARLTLAAGSSAFAAQAALEDALRTADFADAGRLILVRSLSLKGLPRGASGPQVARALERAWQVLAPSALAFDAPGAAWAEVVYFRSVHEARLAWVRRWAEDVPAEEWFWLRALPELAQPGEPGAVLVAVLAALQAEAGAALAQGLEALSGPALRRLMEALPVVVPTALAGFVPVPDSFVEVRRSPAAPEGQGAVPETVAAPAADDARVVPQRAPDVVELPAAIAAAVIRWPALDWRPRWLVALLLRARAGAPVRAIEVEQVIAAAVARADTMQHPHVAAPSAAAREARQPSPATDRAKDATRGAAAGAARQAVAGAGPAHAAARAAPAVQMTEMPTPMPPRGVGHLPWLGTGEDSAWGGLLMLLNALSLLRLPAWLEQQEPPVQQFFARALLAHVAQRLRLPAGDPHQPMFALPHEAQQALQQARCRWDGFAWPAGLDSRGLQAAGKHTDEALACWRRALVRLLRRHAGVGLVHVARRSANVALTPTHADVVLPLAQVEVALRRCGLDSDPGWVPWFGWIVHFHYVDGPEAPHAG